MTKKSELVKHNMTYVVLNWITDNQWYNKDIQESFIKSLNYKYTAYECAEQDVNNAQVKQIMIDFVKSLSNKSNFNKMLNEWKESYICNSFTKLMEEKELSFKNKQELYFFINNKVIPAIQ